MKICFQSSAKHSNGFLNFTLTIYFKLLWKNMYNFLSRHHYQLVNLINYLLNVLYIDNLIRVLSCYIIAMLQTSYVLTCYTNNNFINFFIRIIFSFINSRLYRLNRLTNIIYNTPMNP